MEASEAIIVGTELLLGMGVDTNGPDMARHMAELGCPLRFKTVVGDSDEDLETTLQRAVKRSRVVLLSGGLGPTEDDRTRFAVARVAGVGLEARSELLDDIREAFRRLDREMGESNRIQAELPEGAEAIRNPVGTAPGFSLEIGTSLVVALPGVPRELRFLLKNEALPRIRRFLGVGVVLTRTLRLSGIGESRAGEAIADLMGPGRNPYVGTLASPGEVRVFLSARAAEESAARALIREAEEDVRKRLRKYVFGADDETHGKMALRAAARAGWTVASSEGFTAGVLAAHLWESREENYLGSSVLPPTALRGGDADVGFEHAILSLARSSARTFGASVGLAVALESELRVEASEAAWVGIWTEGPTRGRRVPLFFGDEADRQRLSHQALYELRKLADERART